MLSVSGIGEALRGVHSRRTENPKTILAFYATVLGLTLAAVVGLAGVLASTGTAIWLIPWLVLFGATLVVAALSAVFVVALRDPSKLMLGQVTGNEYVEIQRLTLRTASDQDLTQVGQETQRRIEATGQ